MWLGISDPEGSGRWRKLTDQQPLSWTSWDQKEGAEGDTCARMTADGRWRDTVCKKEVRHCVSCRVAAKGQRTAFTLRGLCADTQIDRGFFLVNGIDAHGVDYESSLMRPGGFSVSFSLLTLKRNE